MRFELVLLTRMSLLRQLAALRGPHTPIATEAYACLYMEEAQLEEKVSCVYLCHTGNSAEGSWQLLILLHSNVVPAQSLSAAMQA